MIKFTAIVNMIKGGLALDYSHNLKFVKKVLVFLLLAFYCPVFSQSVSMDEMKKEADKFFQDENYSSAYKLYSQLVSNFPKDPEYNYRLGVCMIYSEPNKKKCIDYLKFAVNNPVKTTKDAQFYLGKAYHINYLFDEAINNYRVYKSSAGSAQIKKFQVDREIQSCENGKHLLSSISDLEIMTRVALPESDYFRSYKKIGGKLLVKPDDFKTGADKKKKEKSVVFLPNGSNVVYFSSYGDNGETGKDIYTSSKQADGTYSKAKKVEGINTEFDEDYPFLHPNGNTLYFASKGYNSMGGYDIFKSVFNSETNSWGAPVNMEFPINSPDDDYLFVTDSLETLAYFSTGRQSPPGKIDVLKVKTKRRAIDVLALKGQVLPGSPDYPLNSTIVVTDLFDQKEIARYNADDKGNYSMELPNGGKLLFTIETNGVETQSTQVTMPVANTSKPCRQSISYENGKLKVLNYFDEPAKDDDYLQYLSLIEKKAKLEVNEGESRPEPEQTSSGNNNIPVSKSPEQKKPGVGSEVTSKSKNLDNKQLAKLAKQDAQESKNEAAELMRDFIAANDEAKKQKESADKKLTEANSALSAAEAITNEEEKKIAIEKALAIKENAELEQGISAQMSDYATAIDEDAKRKEKESELNAEYAKELDKSADPKNKENSTEKIEALQKEIDELGKQSSSVETYLNDRKNNIEQKESQIKIAEDINAGVKSNLQEINTAIADKESELVATKKKSTKQSISAQISELKAEQEEKSKQVAINDEEIRKLNTEANAIKTGVEMAGTISSENLSAAALDNAVNQKVTATYLKEKYKNKTTVSDPSSTAIVNESTRQLSNYNKEIDLALQNNKDELAKTKNKDAKLQISNEIKQLESLKKQNQSQIASNSTILKDLNKSQATASQPISGTYEPLSASTPEEAVNKLDNLNKQLSVNENENFDYNAYQNPQAQNLKIEADAKINEAVAKQKILKDEISNSKQSLQSTGSTANTAELYKESEALSLQAQRSRDESKNKKGAEKDKLLKEAKDLDDKANEKNLQAAEIIKNDNAAIMASNKENIQNLISENKASASEIEQAKALNDEAETTMKKANDIRTESSSATNIGAKLGGYSNAEEKESEALLKQKQAIDLLVKSNPEFKLKSAVTSTSTTGGTETANKPDVNTELNKVNSGLTDLAAIKTESYQKLFEANQTEIDQQIGDMKKNPNLESTPVMKTELLSLEKKSEKAKTTKTSADNSSSANEKLNLLITAVKQQNEVLKQLSVLNTSLSASPVVASTNSNTNENPEPNITGAATSNTVAETSELGQLGEINTESTTAATAPALNIGTIAEQDTSAGQVANYFEVNKPTVRNSDANTQVQTSLVQLKNLEDQNNVLTNELKKVKNREAGANAGIVSTEDMHEFADELTEEADPLMNKSLELKKSAANKEGEEKSLALAEARKLEVEAQDKLLQASDFRQQANENEYKTNSNAITELLEKLNTDNPDLAAQITERREAYAPLKTQIRNLREEANALNNKAAKLGAISNAEDKELELIGKQKALLDDLKKQYPDYVVKPVVASNPEEEIARIEKDQSALKEKQYTELTSLTNAFSLDYESSKNLVPQQLNPDQKATKQKAESLNEESKKLLMQASSVSNPTEKFQTLSLAAKSGKMAVDELNKLLPQTTATNELDQLAAIGSRLNSESENKSSTSKAAVKIDGLEVVSGNAYSAANPIPMDAKMSDGLVFRVQIGAFKTQIPSNSFKGLSPLNGETTANGYYRYTAGNFGQIEKANAVKNDLRNLGYRDAFVVVYYNGKRITLAEAMAMMEKDGIKMDPNAPQTAGITANANVPKATVNTAIQEVVQVTKELEQTNGLLYTIQIGVYTKQVSKPQILRLRPVFREQLSNGLYRYTAGIYSNTDRLQSDKNRVVDLGIRDAFVSAYLNGKRISFAEAKEKQNSDPSIKLETENPIVFPEKQNAPALNPFEQLVASTPSAVEPFKNSVTSYPVATPDNGVKENEQGMSFKVQIGAFSKQVPEDVASKFSAIKSWPIDNKKINGLFIYNVGNFSEAKFAKALKEEIVRLGINDAFITVYRDGQKLYGPEAEGYLK